jgi:lipid A disaccharide synthetase
MDRPVVTELIQNDLTVENLKRELDLILHHPEKEIRYLQIMQT